MEGPESNNLPDEPAQTQSSSEVLASAGLTRRHVAVLAAGLIAMWLVGVFARQVGTASEAGRAAEALKSRNVSVERDVAGLRTELELIQRPAFIASTARGYMIGSPGETPFTVQGKGTLPADAPGSVGIRPTSGTQPHGPLESWLQVLFGP
jgi:cell division protein FtsB